MPMPSNPSDDADSDSDWDRLYYEDDSRVVLYEAGMRSPRPGVPAIR